ncbi:hypothetical protein LCGC14_1467030 [marine sediment metagenome]|uniref:Uncharacterized protein n=1 Tax=marine sediment metagenome TaxID=412755 RepID=A0A0F9LU62_9ZZZZ
MSWPWLAILGGREEKMKRARAKVTRVDLKLELPKVSYRKANKIVDPLQYILKLLCFRGDIDNFIIQYREE